jgi:hypothetical protein
MFRPQFKTAAGEVFVRPLDLKHIVRLLEDLLIFHCAFLVQWELAKASTLVLTVLDRRNTVSKRLSMQRR